MEYTWAIFQNSGIIGFRGLYSEYDGRDKGALCHLWLLFGKAPAMQLPDSHVPGWTAAVCSFASSRWAPMGFLALVRRSRSAQALEILEIPISRFWFGISPRPRTILWRTLILKLNCRFHPHVHRKVNKCTVLRKSMFYVHERTYLER